MVANSTEAMMSLRSMLSALGLTDADLALILFVVVVFVLALHALEIILWLFKSDGTA